jgi:hypothetical protein
MVVQAVWGSSLLDEVPGDGNGKAWIPKRKDIDVCTFSNVGRTLEPLVCRTEDPVQDPSSSSEESSSSSGELSGSGEEVVAEESASTVTATTGCAALKKIVDEIKEECDSTGLTTNPKDGQPSENELFEVDVSNPAQCAEACSKCGCGGFRYLDNDECFPADATVELERGGKVAMADLKVGDSVRVGASEFSKVYMFTHRNADVQAAFVKLVVAGANQPLRMTGGHYLYVNGKLQTARTVSVGDSVQTAAGAVANVTAVAREWTTGLYNPHTLHGDIVVDNVLTSTYTESVAPALAHALLFPVRALYRAGVTVAGTDWEKGGGSWADAATKLGLRGDDRYEF